MHVFLWVWTALLMICLAPLQSHAVSDGDLIINVAELHTQEGPPAVSSVTVTAVAGTAAPKIELLKYGTTSSTTQNVGETWYRTAGDSAAPFEKMAQLYLPGETSATTLPAPLPLVATAIFHQCEPVFVRVTDSTQNLDRSAKDTVLVTVTNPTTNLTQVLRLTETGNSTGVFLGYIVTTGQVCRSNPPANSYNGFLSVAEAQKIAAQYTNSTSGVEISADAQVDPYGIVFNTVTGTPVSGVTITLLDSSTGLPATVFGDDGVSAFPATVTTGGTPSDASGRVYDFPPGRFRFPFVRPGSYRFEVTARGFAVPSSAADAALQALPGGPFTVTTGSRLEPFRVNPGPAVHIDIPADPLPSTLWLQKTAGKTLVAVGDFLPYQLDLQNANTEATAFGVKLTDTLPPGFRYQRGSTTIDGKKGADPAISADGRTLTYALADLPPGTSTNVRLVVEVGAGANLGTAVNVATATSFATVSNTARAEVEVQTDFLSTRSLIMGRVRRGPCNLDWDEAVEGVRIYLEDGTFVNTDQNGMYHLEGVTPGTHVVQLDLDSLPEGFEVYNCTENSRFAGRAFSQFVDVAGGSMWRADFRVGRPDDVALYEKMTAERAAAQKKVAEEKLKKEAEAARKAEDAKKEAEAQAAAQKEGTSATKEKSAPAAAPIEEDTDAPVVDDWAEPTAPAVQKAVLPAPSAPKAAPQAPVAAVAPVTAVQAAPPVAAKVEPPRPRKVGIILTSVATGDTVRYQALITAGKESLSKRVLKVTLPAGILYRAGSSELDGRRVADPQQEGNTLNFVLGGCAAGCSATLRFCADPSGAAVGGELTTSAVLAFNTGTGADLTTPAADNALHLIREQKMLGMPEIVLRPHFPVFEAELSDEDRGALDEMARLLTVLQVEEITVSGHTDSMAIARRSREIYHNNTELSFARAKSVGRYLMDKLHLPPAKLNIFGYGEKRPVATNHTPAGRAKNRRVELRVKAGKLVELTRPELTKKESALQERVIPAAALVEAPEVKASAAPLEISAPAVSALSEPTVFAPAANAAPLRVAEIHPHPGSPLESHGEPASASDAALRAVTAALPSTTSELKAGAALTTAALAKAAAPAKEQPAAAPAPVAATPAPAAPAAPAEGGAKGSAEKEPRLEKTGVLSPVDGATLPEAINAVRIVLDSKLTPLLLVDGREIPAERIGFTMQDPKTEKSLYSYIGVNFGEPGAHTMTVQGKDPFGVVRYDQTVKVTRSGAIAAIRVVETQGNIADGKTPVRIRLQLFDAAGVPINAATELPLLDGTLRPLKKENKFPDAVEEKQVRVAVDVNGYALFQPVNNSGLYRVALGTDKVNVETETYVQPKLRDWILVGLAEGTAGYNTVSGHLENLRSSGAEENLYEDGRIAFYGKGTVQGKWLMTMAYDTAKTHGQVGNSLFQTINPESFYTLYGDASQQQYDAASARKLYLKIEREQFYALFGDYDTNLTVTELSRYSRRLNGLKAEWQGKNLEANLFGADTTQAYTRDEIQGDGTSGLYHLSHKPIVMNSDKVTVQVRDRFRSEIILSSKTLNRFTDYSIDYDSGTVLFKEPIHSRDESFNPIFIIAEYETISSGDSALTYGGRVGAKLLNNRVRTGFTYLHEGQVSGSGDSFGVDAAWKLTPETTFRTEAARTVTDFGTDSRHGNAFLAELKKQSPRFLGKLYYREQDTGFGLGQQNGSETGTRKEGADGAYKLTDALSLGGELYRQYNLQTGAVQDLAEAKTTYGNGPYGAHLGVRYASDLLGDGSRETSYQLTSGVSWLTLNKRLTLRADHDQSIGGNSNATYPTRTSFGADYAISEKVTATASQEFTSGSGADTSTTRVGLKATPWNGGTINTGMQRDLNENSDRVLALFGLKQSFKVTDKWSVDAGLDRSQTVHEARSYTFNVNVPPASGSSEDFTAVSLGSSYQEKKWTWHNRVEYRTATSEQKWGMESAFMGEPQQGWGWSTRLQLFDTKTSAGDNTTQGDLRLGLVYRPLRTRWIILDRLDLIYNKQATAGSDLESRRLVNNLNANFKPDRDTEISLQYGAKYTLETIDGSEYSGYTDLMGVEGRYDLTKKWDVGVRGSLLHSWGAAQLKYSSGLSVGYNVMENAWVSVGYNFTGFTDEDFSASNYTAQGPYVKFRFKFDQNSVKDAVKWVNR